MGASEEQAVRVNLSRLTGAGAVRTAKVSLAIGVLLALSTDLGASVLRPRVEPKWCPVDRPSSTAALRQPLNLSPILASVRAKPATPRPRPKVELAKLTPTPPSHLHRPPAVRRPAPTLVRYEPALFSTPFFQRMTASCIGDRASILCPGYLVVGTEY